MSRAQHGKLSEFNNLPSLLLLFREFTNDLDNFVNGNQVKGLTSLEKKYLKEMMDKVEGEVNEIRRISETI